MSKAIGIVFALILAVAFGILAITKFFQPRSQIPEAIAAGKPLYTVFCSSCHKDHGRGVPSEFPPLAGSDYLYLHSSGHLIRFLLFGYRGKMIVNNRPYEGDHQPFEHLLSDEQLAQLLSYVYNAWSNVGPIITADTVAIHRTRRQPVTASEVLFPAQGLSLQHIPHFLLLEHGKKVYQWYCRNCHGIDGTGRPGLYPPLRNADYLQVQPLDTIIHNIIFGLQRPIVVNGITYRDRRMPPLSPMVSDIDLAGILVYLFTELTPREFQLDLSKLRRIRQSDRHTASYRKAP